MKPAFGSISYLKHSFAQSGKTVIGITGPMCGGKTTFMKAMKEAAKGEGIFIDMDTLAKKVLYVDKLEETEAALGFSVFKGDKKTLDTQRISDHIFSSKNAYDKFAAYTRPPIGEELVRQLYAATPGIIVFETAQLYQSNLHQLCQTVILVKAHEKDLLARAKKRGYTQAEVKKRLRFQGWNAWDSGEFAKRICEKFPETQNSGILGEEGLRERGRASWKSISPPPDLW